ncbi:MAG: hypothetical protein DRG83_05160 [Deltaproteobacteria bacterium]|nr:MAG: hypothetical protein DRG83_05160 [Deltaproteobacteria bacterium]
MCDILAISAGYNYSPGKYLPIFAEKGKRNMTGWGIGFFREHMALVEKSAEQVFDSDQVHESFQRLARVIDSRIIVSHVSCPLSGSKHSAHNHPFTLTFLNHSWLFAHVGIVDNIESYKTTCEPKIDVDVYTARIFEYLRDRIVEIFNVNPYISFLQALRNAIMKINAEFPGCYAFFLANESVLYSFHNFRPLVILKESEKIGNVLIVTSIEEGLTDKGWHEMSPKKGAIGKLLIIAGPDLLYSEDVI